MVVSGGVDVKVNKIVLLMPKKRPIQADRAENGLGRRYSQVWSRYSWSLNIPLILSHSTWPKIFAKIPQSGSAYYSAPRSASWATPFLGPPNDVSQSI